MLFRSLYNPASEAPKSQAELMKKEFEARGGQVVAFETYATGDKDFSAQWKKIAESAPDVVFLPSYYGEIPEQIRQARAAGVTAPFLGSDTWTNSDLLKSAAEVDGAFFCAHYNPDAMEDKVGIFHSLRAHIAALGKCIFHAFRIIDIHLATIGLHKDLSCILAYIGTGILRGFMPAGFSCHSRCCRDGFASFHLLAGSW